MPRKMRVEYAGAIYHVMSRGDRREDIFLDDVVERAIGVNGSVKGCKWVARGGVGWVGFSVVAWAQRWDFWWRRTYGNSNAGWARGGGDRQASVSRVVKLAVARSGGKGLPFGRAVRAVFGGEFGLPLGVASTF
jgi:hypothetical protein